MNANFRVTNPDEIEMELTITMTLLMWKSLQKQLQDLHPSWQLSSLISDMIDSADRHFYPRADDD